MIERAAAGAEILLVNVEQALDRIEALITQARRDAGGTDLVTIRLERRLAEAEGAGRRPSPSGQCRSRAPRLARVDREAERERKCAAKRCGGGSEWSTGSGRIRR